MALGDNISIRKDRLGWFYVVLAFRLPMEDMFDDATHVARFEAIEDAEALKQRLIGRFISRKVSHHGFVDIIDRRYWQGPKSVSAPLRWDAEVEPFFVNATKI